MEKVATRGKKEVIHLSRTPCPTLRRHTTQIVVAKQYEQRGPHANFLLGKILTQNFCT